MGTPVRLHPFQPSVMAFVRFHPVVREWFTAGIGTPTEAQLRGWEAIAAGRHTLIAAPTGSGKTLTAFLTAINALVEEGQRGPLPDQVRVVYVSPLKALSADIHKNLAEPRAGILRQADAAGLRAPAITAAVRTSARPGRSAREDDAAQPLKSDVKPRLTRAPYHRAAKTAPRTAPASGTPRRPHNGLPVRLPVLQRRGHGFRTLSSRRP